MNILTTATTTEYQSWEDELEAPGLDENGVSLVSVIFSALLGVVLLGVVLLKTAVSPLFKITTEAPVKKR
jgi:hypothetical protein